MSRDYFISANGDDKGLGTVESPWKSLARINSICFSKGDRILLDSRAPHSGSLALTHQNGVTITSYGSEKPAVIHAGSAIAVLIRNCSDISVSRLHLIGSGYPENQTHGLCVFADEFDIRSEMPADTEIRRYENFVVQNVEIEKFGCAGLGAGAAKGLGLRNLRVENVRAHDNAYAGIFIWGPTDDRVHEDIVVQSCQAFDNHGVPGLKHTSGHGHHSGHGIFMSCTNRGRIESCHAFRNGSRNTANVCGPAGIWTSNSRRITIRGNTSFQNRSAGASDGAGFGFDGGMQDSIMTENTSYENDGAGYLMAQYYGARPFSNNQFINNSSVDDARHNDNGAIHVWCPRECSMTDLLIEGNRVEISASRRGRPRALFIDAVTDGLRVEANSFSGPGLKLMMQVSPVHTDFVFKQNQMNGSGAVHWRGQIHEEMSGWLETFPQ